MADLRVFFEKNDTARFISHLDLNRTFTRALFASKLPVWFTEGFNRHPHLVFGQPLPLGMAGERETLDMRMTDEVDGALVVTELNKQLPYGIRVIDAAAPIYAHKEIRLAQYRIDLDAKYAADFERFWSAQTITAEKKTKRAIIEVDLKQEVRAFSQEILGNRLILHATMPCSFECSIGPAVLLSAFEKEIGQAVFRYSTRERFLLHDFTEFR